MIENITVSFETKCYEKDWTHVLKSDKIIKLLDNCNYFFNKKTVYINNVNNILEVSKFADKLISKNIIDEYIIVEKHSKDALNFFDIDINSFKGGYYYSISELVGIYLSDSDYIVHFSSDSDMVNKYDWISESINKMINNDNISIANPSWSKNIDWLNSIHDDELFYYELGGFSDQCYLINSNEFKKKIYNEFNIKSQRFPPYGGESFEKRVDSYLLNNNKIRIISKNAFYIHKNI